jgi:hypothetical protein
MRRRHGDNVSTASEPERFFRALERPEAMDLHQTQQAVDHAGRDIELAYQEMLKGLELKRDLDTILAGTSQAKDAGSSSTPRNTASVLSWIVSNTSKGTAGGAADPAAADGSGTRTDGTQIAFTEARLKSVLSSIWTNGGKPGTIMTGAFNKRGFENVARIIKR